MRKHVFILFAAIAIAGVVNAQESGFSRSLRLSFGYLNTKSLMMHPEIAHGVDLSINSTPTINIDAELWRVGKNTGLGLYANFSPVVEQSKANVMYDLGAGLRYHVLLAAGVVSSKWDLTLNANVGVAGAAVSPLKVQLGCNAGVTATFYPFKRFGIFVEGSVGRWDMFGGYYGLYSISTMLKTGVSYRF